MSKTPEEMAKEYAFKFYLYKAAKDQSPDATKWISVKDRLPDIDQWCSWWDISGATEPCTAFRDINDIETWWENYTHWMPLPAPPKEEK